MQTIPKSSNLEILELLMGDICDTLKNDVCAHQCLDNTYDRMRVAVQIRKAILRRAEKHANLENALRSHHN